MVRSEAAVLFVGCCFSTNAYIAQINVFAIRGHITNSLASRLDFFDVLKGSDFRVDFIHYVRVETTMVNNA